MQSTKMSDRFESDIRMLQRDIIKHDLRVKATLQDIRECQDYNPETLSELNFRVTDDMRKIKTALDDLSSLIKEQDREEDKKVLQKELESLQKQYSANQFALRKANLNFQISMEKKNKAKLLEKTNETEGVRKRTRADKELLAKQSSAITDSLVSLSSLMISQVKQSEESLHVLVNSSSVVTETKEEFKTMGGVISQSKNLLQKYGRREFTDRLLIVLAFIFFLGCVVYVVQKRVF